MNERRIQGQENIKINAQGQILASGYEEVMLKCQTLRSYSNNHFKP